MKDFPNGFSNWQETHYEIVSMITLSLNIILLDFAENYGIGGCYKLAEILTDKFEKKNEGREWDGEFFEEIESFFEKEINNL